MKDVNKMIVVGRLGAAPEQRETKSGYAVVHFPVATSRWVLPEGAEPGAERQEETQWHHIVVWGRQGEACAQYLKKGHLVYVEGSVRSHRYEAKDGNTKMAFEVYAESVSFLGRPLPVVIPSGEAKAAGGAKTDAGAGEATREPAAKRGRPARTPVAAASA